jgi:Kinase associated domain 1
VSAWKQAQQLSGNTSDMAVDMRGEMRVIAGDDGHYTRVPNLTTRDFCIKIGLTLYKVQQSIYLLDFQKMTGDAFSFMTLCANIITEFKTLSAVYQQQQQQAMMAKQQAMMAQQQALADPQVAMTQQGFPVVQK